MSLDEYIPEIKEITLQKIKVARDTYVPKEVLENTSVDFVSDHLRNSYLAHFETWLAAEVKEDDVEVSVKYPATCWQMFKEQYFPYWLKKKFPVQYKTKSEKKHIEMMRVFPELEIDLKRPLYKIIYRKEL